MAVTNKRRVDAYLELETDRELRETARLLDRSVTWCVRKAVEEWLEGEREKTAAAMEAATGITSMSWPKRKER